jgi:hypothetical protein
MTDIYTADDDRRVLRAAPADSDDWDDDTWAAWFRCAARAHGERFDGDTKPANPRALLGAILHSARLAVALTEQGEAAEAKEHVGAIERLVAGYRKTVQPDREVASREDLEQLVQDLAQTEPCQLDHNGGCQAHWWFPSDGTPCPHGRAQALFPDIKE